MDENVGNLKECEKKISLVTLMGLPGSGKTTLCDELLLKFEDTGTTKLIKLSLDEFIPLSVQSSLTDNDDLNKNGVSTSVSKVLRHNFSIMINHFVIKLKTNNLQWPIGELLQKLSTTVDNALPALVFPTKLKELTSAVDWENYSNIILLIDDNNYYRSMRNEFYQIAKCNKLGFCVLYPKTPLEICQQRNLGRVNPIPPTVIEEMNSKLEEPNPLQNPCDELCLQIADVKDPTTLSLIQTHLEYSLTNPISWDPPLDRSADIAKERRICQENEIHQADLVLRKWIHTEAGLASFRLKKEEKLKFCEELVQKKAAVMHKLRSGELKITAKVDDDFGFRKEILCLTRSINIHQPCLEARIS